MTNLTICHDGGRPSLPREISAVRFVDAIGPTANAVAQAPETAYRPGLPIASLQSESHRVVQS